MDKQAVTTIRNEILQSMLPHVPFDGWTWAGVERAAAEAGYDAKMATAVFPAKMLDVMDAFAALADVWMLKALSGMEAEREGMRVRDKVRAGVLARLDALAPHKEAVRRSILFWALPTRKLRGGKIVWRSADAIWDWAGDTATDYNRYTKRTLLSGILIATMMVWLDDNDPDIHDTKAFLDRRIENVMTLGKMMGKAGAKFSKGKAA